MLVPELEEAELDELVVVELVDELSLDVGVVELSVDSGGVDEL